MRFHFIPFTGDMEQSTPKQHIWPIGLQRRANNCKCINHHSEIQTHFQPKSLLSLANRIVFRYFRNRQKGRKAEELIEATVPEEGHSSYRAHISKVSILTAVISSIQS